MSEPDHLRRLGARLARLAEASPPVTPAGRLVGTAPRLLASLLREIDETVLARRLRFQTDAGQVLVCDAYGRRLLALIAAGSALSGRALGAGDHDSLRALFDGFLHGAARLHVVPSAADTARDPAAFGIAATALAAAWDLELDAEPPLEAPLDALLAAAGGGAIAWLRVQNGVLGPHGGEARRLAGLMRFAAEAIPALRSVAPDAQGGASSGDRLKTAAPPRCVVLGRQSDGGTLILAEDGHDALALLLGAGEVSRATSAWRRVVG